MRHDGRVTQQRHVYVLHGAELEQDQSITVLGDAHPILRFDLALVEYLKADLGSVLAGMLLGAIGAFIIDRRLVAAASTALIGAALAFIGLIHAPQLGWAAAPAVSLGYVAFAVICFVVLLQPKDKHTAAG